MRAKHSGHASLISLIIPIYQAESFIAQNLQRLAQYRTVHEIVLVDDGSHDQTRSIIDTFLSSHPDHNRFKTVYLDHNVGKGGAIKAGIQAAEGDFIVFTDCDLPYAFSDIDRVIEQLSGNHAHIVIGSRMHPESVYHIRSQNLSYIYIRHTSGRLFNRLVKWITGLNLADTQAGLKGFDRETARLCFEKLTVPGFAFDIDLLVCAQANGRHIVTLPLNFNYESEMSTVSFLKNALLMNANLWRIRFKRLTGYYTRNS